MPLFVGASESYDTDAWEAYNLKKENAKLRELVHALLRCSIEGDDICAKCNYRSPLHGRCMADVKADELEIEVD